MFCADHARAGGQLFPNLTLDALAAEYHEGTNATTKVLIDEAVENMNMQPEELVFDLPASINTASKQGTQIYFDLGFVSDKDIIRLTGKSAEYLQLKPERLTLEQRGCTVLGFLISLRGLLMDEIASMRKVRVYRDVHLEMSESNLSPATMIHKKQPSMLCDFLSSKQVEKYPPPMKSTRGDAPTIQDSGVWLRLRAEGMKYLLQCSLQPLLSQAALSSPRAMLFLGMLSKLCLTCSMAL